MRVIAILMGAICLAALAERAAAYDKNASGNAVDSGSFGIYLGGRRVATETFSIRQDAGGISTSSSQLKEDAAAVPSQRCEMKVTSGGALVSYEWHELSPGKSELVVLPNNEFLIEKITETPGEKAKEQPFLMPNTSVILDNNFFVLRQVLAWRYLASSCVAEGAQRRCGPAQFGAVIPQDRVSLRINVQPVGDEKVTIRGVERLLLRITLKSDDGDWDLWLDPQDRYKLLRVTKAGEATEILRD